MNRHQTHFLFVTWEGGGNVAPVLGTARRLLARGHRVHVLTEPCLRDAVEGIGAEFVAFREYFVRTDRQAELLDDWRGGTPLAKMDIAMQRVVFGPAGVTAREIGRVIDELRPDALVVDWMMPTGVAVAEARGLPSAVLLHCTNMLPAPGRPAGPMPLARGPLGRLRDRLMLGLLVQRVRRHAPTYNAMRHELGLEPLTDLFDQFSRADRVLVQTSPAFDFVADPEPENVRYVGPVLDEPDWLGPTTWTSPWPEDDTRPLVVVSLSSTFQDQLPVLEAAAAALGRLDVRGLITLGPAMDHAELELPPNVIAIASAPHSAVFPHAAAFVTHCGHGSIMRALAHGVPLVALPMGRDQDANATRIVHHGFGVRARRSARSISRSVARVLDDASFRARARTMADVLAREVEADALTEHLEHLVRGRKSTSDPRSTTVQRSA